MSSWGLVPRTRCDAIPIARRTDPLPESSKKILPYGLGRSYGDSCLNHGEAVLTTRPGLGEILDFDPERGVLRCEAGVSIDEILSFAIPKGFFMPVVPGTKHVTVGGAIANDIHGKNHHRRGTVGSHLSGFELLRSDGERRYCSLEENAELYRATIGGLGLTGLVTFADVRLLPVEGSSIAVKTIPFADLAEFLEISTAVEKDHEYAVAWVDCFASGRGIFMAGDHSEDTPSRATGRGRIPLRVPFPVPTWILNRLTIRTFNGIYFRSQRARRSRTLDVERFFFPLDAIGSWNRLYGRRGFFQYQCVVPRSGSTDALRDLFERIRKSGQGSFLSVLKAFGAKPSPGLMSFPMEGVTLALDFANRGQRTLDLLADLDTVVLRAGGRVYPAKDARMSPATFRRYYPQWETFARFVDPAFSSSFWRRVTSFGPDDR